MNAGNFARTSFFGDPCHPCISVSKQNTSLFTYGIVYLGAGSTEIILGFCRYCARSHPVAALYALDPVAPAPQE